MTLIQKISRKYEKPMIMLVGSLAICLFYFAWCCSTISYQGQVYAAFYLLLSVLSACCYESCLCLSARNKKGSKERGLSVSWMGSVCSQFGAINIGIFVVFMLMLVWDIRNAGFGRKENLVFFILADLVWICCSIRNFRILPGNISRKSIGQISVRRQYVVFFIFLAVILLLAIEPGQLQFRWDGALYEQACRIMNIHSLSSLGAYGHLSQGYGVLYCLLSGVIGSTGIAMEFLNIGLFIWSIVIYYLLVRFLVPGKHWFLYLAGTAVYSFSPFLLGMVNYYSLDYMTSCLFVMVAYTAFKRKWIFHLVSAFFFVFTKEPAIIVYGAFCAGIVISDFIGDQGSSVGERIRHLLGQCQYYLMLLIGMLWGITYLLIGGWSGGVGEFEFDISFAVDKLKVLYILNFNWVIVTGIICGGIIWLYNVRKGEAESKNIRLWILPLLLSMIAFTIFSIIFRTTNHARYSAAGPVILYLMGFYVICRLVGSEVLKAGLLSIYAVLMLVSSYLTIDPVSLSVFKNMDIGSRTMITTGSPVIGDSMIYNKQMLYEEYAFNQALEYAIEREYKILIPTYGDSVYAFDGMMSETTEYAEYYETEQYWDTEDNRRCAYENDRTNPFLIYEVKENFWNQNFTGEVDESVCYIYSPTLGAEFLDGMQGEKPALRAKRFSYRGWSVYLAEL